MKESGLAILKPIFERHQVAVAYLFGSQVSGTAGSLSDTDIAYLGESISDEDSFGRDSELATDIRQALGTDRVDVVNLAGVKDPVLKYHAAVLGQPIFVRSPSIKAAFERATLREYEETKYLRETSHRILLRQIKEGRLGLAPTHVASK